MHTKTLIASMLLVLACSASPAIALADDDDTKAVKQATAHFYKCLNTMFTGDAGPMREIWSHANDVTYLGPAGEFLVGWHAVSDAWEVQAAMRLGGTVESYDPHFIVGDNLAISQCFEKGTNWDSDGHNVLVSIRATNLFRKENGEWKMIGHHTDVLPFLEKQTLTKSDE